MKVSHFSNLKEVNDYIKDKSLPSKNIRTIVTQNDKSYIGYNIDYFVIENDAFTEQQEGKSQ